MMLRFSLTFSLALSLLCNAIIGFLWWSSANQVPRHAGQMSPSVPADSVAADGLAPNQSKALFLRQLEQQHIAGLPVVGDRYWEQNPRQVQSEMRQTFIEAQDRIRDALLKRFGGQAIEDPVFRPYFYPLGRQAFYLSSADQIALQREQTRLQAQWSKNARQGIFTTAPQGSDAATPTPATPMDPSRVLSGTARREYARRHSPLAELLRGSGVTFTQESYDRSFVLLDGMFPVDLRTTPEQRGQALGQLGKMLGSRDSLALWEKIDPQFARIVRTGREYGLRDHTLLAAYDILADGDYRLYQAHLRREFDPVDTGNAIREVLAERRDRLEALVGPEAGQALLRPPTSGGPVRNVPGFSNLPPMR